MKRKWLRWLLTDIAYLGIGVIFGVLAMLSIAYFLT